MKREKFLWSITHAHHYGLMAAKALRRTLEEKPNGEKLGILRKKTEKFFRSDLSGHIAEEEKILGQLAFHAGSTDPNLERARREHRELDQLLEKGDARSLELFADKLIRHIYFEEDELLGEVEDQFTPAEKEWVETDIRFNIHGWPRIPAFVER